MNNYKGLQEAYEAVYNQELRQQLVEKKEFENLVNEVFYTIAVTMVAEGYTLDQVIQYFAEEDVDNIVETYYNCDLTKVSLNEDTFTEQFKDYIVEAPNLFNIGRQPLQQASGRLLKTANTTFSFKPKGKPGVGDWLGQGLKLAGGGLRNVVTTPIVAANVALQKARGQRGLETITKMAGYTPQQAQKAGTTGTFARAVERTGQENVRKATEFIKNKAIPALGLGAAGSGVLGGTYAAGHGGGRGAERRDLARGQGSIVRLDPQGNPVVIKRESK